MPITPGPNVRTVADAVKTLTHCSDIEADHVEAAICRNPEVLGKLAVACGIATGQTGFGGTVAVTSASATSVGLLFAGIGVAAGVVIAAKGAQKAKLYCGALIRHGTANLTEAAIEINKGLLE